MLTINPKHTDLPDFQALLQSAVAPRPIAWASTIDQEGNVNLSPFSFFNVFGTNPPTLIFAPNRRARDGSNKDTFHNICKVKEVVIHMVDFELGEKMSLSSSEYAKGTNEFLKAGLTPVPSFQVKPPRIYEAKVAFECTVNHVIEMGVGPGSANLIICEVVLMHVSEDILDKNGRIDPLKTDWIARSGGNYYVRANAESMFEIPKPNSNLGVGVDSIPLNLRSFFTHNELGRLGNISNIPNDIEVSSFRKKYDSETNFIELAKQFLMNLDLSNAWCAILNI